ncbi:MAG: TAXI family TRAP transporter solute-binding subunit [Rhodospirillaceae bacterium]|nr:TAXI family TRAP transporter solute-binding subunit [Rhodospirillaceae bacterium]
MGLFSKKGAELGHQFSAAFKQQKYGIFFLWLRKISAAILINLVLLPSWLLSATASLVAQDVQFFRIGTDNTGTTFFPLGGVIAAAISNPAGSRSCDQGGSCGVPGLIAVAQTTRGSIANVEAVSSLQIESGLVQSDIALWAFQGSHLFSGKAALSNLRVIASLYQESLHIIVPADSTVNNISQLKGKRISLGEKDGGSYPTALVVLGSYNLDEKDFIASHSSLRQALEELRDGKIDAIFVVGGSPLPAIVDYTQTNSIRLLPIDGEGAAVLRQKYPFLGIEVIQEGSYRGVGNTVTIGISTLWVTNADIPDDVVYKITRALWITLAKKMVDANNPVVPKLRFETALNGIPIPIHPGAMKFYGELEKAKP